MSHRPSRRSLLRAAGVLVTCSLAGCSMLESDPNDPTTAGSPNTSSPLSSSTDTKPECIQLSHETPSSEDGVWVAFAFANAVAREDDPPVTIRCSKMVLRGGTGHELRTFDIGGGGEEPEFVHGVYEPRQGDERTYRWFGKEAIVRFPSYEDFESLSQVDVVARPADSETAIRATTYAKNAAHYAFDRDGWYSYPITFHGERNCSTTAVRR